MSTPYIPGPDFRPRRKSKVKPVLIGAGLFVLGLIAGGSTSASVSEPQTVEVEKRVEVPGPERTVEVPTPVTPDECLEALDHADAGFNAARDILQALLDQDVAAMESGNVRLETLAPKYNAAKDVCRAARS